MIFFTCLVLGRDRSAMNPSVTPMRNELEDWLPMQNIASLRNQWMPRKPGSPTPYEDIMEKRRQNIARNQEMLQSMMGPDVGLTKHTRGQDSESAGTVSETPGSPTPYEDNEFMEKRRKKIASLRNQEMLRSIMGPDVGPTKYTRGQDSESAGTVSETINFIEQKIG